MPRPATWTIHGNFAWSCAAGCAADKNSTCTGRPFVAGTSVEGTHVFAECADEIFERPDVYDDINLVLHGTHLLTDDQILEVYGPDRGMPPPRAVDLETADIYLSVLDAIVVGGAFVTVAIDNDGDVHLLTANGLKYVLLHPDHYAARGFTLYGTHILPNDILDLYFLDEEED